MNILNKIKQYYRDIDNNDLDKVFDLFGDQSIYKRGDSFLLFGKEEIVSFYKTTRSLKGTHFIDSISLKDNKVFVNGFFKGLSDRKKIELSFSDEWFFHGLLDQVVFRQSKISVPGV